MADRMSGERYAARTHARTRRRKQTALAVVKMLMLWLISCADVCLFVASFVAERTDVHQFDMPCSRRMSRADSSEEASLRTW